MKRVLAAVCLIVLMSGAVRVAAQVNPYKDGTPGVTGYRSEVLAEVIVQEDKFTRLAEAIPADKLVGTPPPTGLDIKALEKSATDKEKVIATLKDSFAHAKAAIKAMPDADLEKSLDWFGGKNTERGVLLFIVRHAAEHLGQSIAYARFAGIVPPWTEDAQRKPPEKKETPKEKQ